QTPLDLESSHFDGWDSFPEGRTAEWQFTNDTKEGGSSAGTPTGTQAPGGSNSVCEVNTFINLCPALELRLKRKEPRTRSEKRSMNADTIRERSSSLSLSMKRSYHGRRLTSAVTARMNSARSRSRLSLVRNICGTSSRC